jgi:hypothetical protein
MTRRKAMRNLNRPAAAALAAMAILTPVRAADPPAVAYPAGYRQ